LATFQHPASLNVFLQYRQACSILRTTSRASNSAWYQESLDLNFQLHIRTGGDVVTTFYHDRKQSKWSPGPTLTDEILRDPAKVEAVILESVRIACSNGASSLGVILHIADEFATTEIKPELDNPAALAEIRETVVHDPGAILEDTSIVADQGTWRLIPYPAAGSAVIATTVALSKQHAALLLQITQIGEAGNFPIITHALAAPLVAIMGLSQTLQASPGKPFVAILQYPWFTTLAFFNEHGDLRLIRTLQHRGLRRPTNFRNALSTTNASLEFIDPDLFLVPLGSNVDPTLISDLKITFTNSRVEIIQQKAVDGVPSWSPEPVIAADVSPETNSENKSHTFGILREDKWSLQNFLPTPKEVVEIFPARNEMRLLKIARLSRIAVVGLAMLCISYFVFGMFEIIRQPEWAFDPSQADAAKSRLAKLTLEKGKSAHWDNLLDDRSKAWSNMEFLSRLFPHGGGMLVKTFSHSSRPNNTPGQSKVGFIKEWKLTGSARDEALDYLNTLNTREGISAHFTDVARITGNSSFDPSIGNRNIVVNVRTQENANYKPIPTEEVNDADDSTYPFTFDLTITQRFEAEDPLAITTAKAP